ncbi:MAG TPA: AF1514 family protein [Rhodocyclaceae bacterium]|nr:AF1514 family protein [Rhodocyclaceae bacterium]
MKQVRIRFSGTEMDYSRAAELARVCAREDSGVADPVLMAWCDRKTGRTSPVIEGSDPRYRWRDYGASHGGQLEVDVGDSYAFIYADCSDFGRYEPSPYSNLVDDVGREYICQINMLADPHRPAPGACTPLDEWTSKWT